MLSLIPSLLSFAEAASSPPGSPSTNARFIIHPSAGGKACAVNGDALLSDRPLVPLSPNCIQTRRIQPQRNVRDRSVAEKLAMSLPSPQTKKLKVSNNLTPSVNPNLVNLTRKEPGLDDTTNIQYHYRVGPRKHGQSSIMYFFGSVQRGAPTPSAKKEVDNTLDNASKGGSGKVISIRPDHKKITDEKLDAEEEHVGDNGYDEEEEDFDDTKGDELGYNDDAMDEDVELHGRGVSSGNGKYELHGRGISSCARSSSRTRNQTEFFADFENDEVDDLDDTTDNELDDYGKEEDAMDDDDTTDNDDEHLKTKEQMTAVHAARMALKESKRIAAEGRLKATYKNADKYQAEFHACSK